MSLRLVRVVSKKTTKKEGRMEERVREGRRKGKKIKLSIIVVIRNEDGSLCSSLCYRIRQLLHQQQHHTLAADLQEKDSTEVSLETWGLTAIPKLVSVFGKVP